jgi:DNA-binding Lrp family transcriptional regulator
MPISSLDDIDFKVVDALQLNPRVSFAKVARAIKTDAATVSRRWDRLSSSGAAWVSTFFAPEFVHTAIVEISSHSGNVVELARRIAKDPETVTVDVVTGGHDIMATVVCSSADALSSYLLDRLGPMDGVASVQSQPATSVVVEGSRWRVRALDDREAALVPVVHSPPSPRHRRDEAFELLLATELARDGRVSAAHIAAERGYGIRKVRDGLADLLSSGRVRLRTEFARHHAGSPVAAYFSIIARAPVRDEAARALSRLLEARAVLQVVGRSDIVLAVWMRDLKDVTRLETAIEKASPGLRVRDRSVVMRTIKIGGHLVDERGYDLGYVPMQMFDGVKAREVEGSP